MIFNFPSKMWVRVSLSSSTASRRIPEEFPKNSRSNITEREALSTAAAAFITATDKQLADLIAKGGVFELECEKS
jgi:hypothetical protein